MKRILFILFLLVPALSVFAQNNIPGTVITAPVVPNDLRDDYPTHIDKYGRGGYRVVATKSERDSIKTSHRTSGMLVYVQEVDSTYILQYGITNATWKPYRSNEIIGMIYMNPLVQTVSIPKQASIAYIIMVTCLNYNGNIPFVIYDRSVTGFKLKVAEQCNCNYIIKPLQ